VAYGQAYADIAISFVLSEDLREKEYFEIWQDSMVNTGAFNPSGVARERSAMNSYNVRYFDNYTKTIVIRQYGSAGNLRSIHTLNEAYPIIINPIAMAWGEESIMRMNVTFAYRNYQCIFNKSDQPTKGFGGSLRIDRDGISGSLSLPGLGNINASIKKGKAKIDSINAQVRGVKNKVAVIRSLF